MAKKLWSIFTHDMDCCIVTGQYGVERHHVYGKNKRNKAFCEKHGYMAPLIPRLHPNGANCEHSDFTKELDRKLKKQCQDNFLANHGTREEFYEIIGRFYD